MACPFSNNQDGEGENGAVGGEKGEKDLTYVDYLQLNKLLDCVELRTGKLLQEPVHDEHLFITVHQAYEVWFKQMIFEVDSIHGLLKTEPWDPKKQLTLQNRIERINLIFKLVYDQLFIMETLQPLSFYAFRKFLFPASGFQSHQFRILENKLGLKRDWRVKYQQEHYDVSCAPEHRTLITKAEDEDTLLTLVVSWLENTPDLKKDGFDFQEEFCAQVKTYLKKEYFDKIEAAQDEKEKAAKQKSYEGARQMWKNILEKKEYDKLEEQGDAHFTHKAAMGALLVAHYRHEPRYQQAFQFMTKIMDLDASINQWRFRHVLMVHRFIGSKPGTGGSSGFQYLRSTIAERYKIFLDIFNLSNYFLPDEYLPKLP